MGYDNAMSERVPPQNIEAEQSILGSLMISAEAIASVFGIFKRKIFTLGAILNY